MPPLMMGWGWWNLIREGIRFKNPSADSVHESLEGYHKNELDRLIRCINIAVEDIEDSICKLDDTPVAYAYLPELNEEISRLVFIKGVAVDIIVNRRPPYSDTSPYLEEGE